MEDPLKVSTIAVLHGKALTIVKDKQSEWSKNQKNTLSKSSAIQILLTEYAELLGRNRSTAV